MLLSISRSFENISVSTQHITHTPPQSSNFKNIIELFEPQNFHIASNQIIGSIGSLNMIYELPEVEY